MKVKKHVTAGCYLVRKNPKNDWEVFMIYRKFGPLNKEGWTFPKGHVEKGETLEESAKRETMEETGYVNFEIVKLLKTRKIKYEWDDGFMHHKDIHYFLAKLTGDERRDPTLDEHEKENYVKMEWMGLKEAEKVILFEDERKILTELIEDTKTLISGNV